MSYFVNAGVFLIQAIFDFLIGIFIVRVMLIAAGASFLDPVCQFVYRLTNPVLAPLRRVVPRWGKIETASVLVACLLALVEFALLGLVGMRLSLFGWPLLSLVNVLSIALWIMFWAIMIRCVLSFFVNEHYNSNARLLVQITEPIVRPFRRMLPALGGLDLSCWFASLALILARLLILAPLSDLAARL